MFKIGDKVTLSPKGVVEYSKNDWSGYHIPYSILKNGGLVTSIEEPYSGEEQRGCRVFVTCGNSTVYLFEDELESIEGEVFVKLDSVNSPSHYALFDDVEAIEVIARSLTKEEFRGYCFGNLLKYRLRCGKKDNVEQELAKADKYKELYEKYKDFCYE